MKETKLNFYDYIRTVKTTKSFSDNIMFALNNYKFELLRNSNSHNYDQFVNKEGFLIFNNISDASITSNSITRGCVNDHDEGNTLRFEDISPVFNVSKTDILKEIEALNKELLILNDEKNEKLKQLEFLVETNKEELVKSEFEEFVINAIVKKKN